MSSHSQYDRIAGCLLGTAVGDSLGVPREGLSRERARRMHGSVLKHRLLFGRGMISDDTEHAAMAALSHTSPDFERELRRQLRKWFLCLPAGIGLATLKACLKLSFGIKNSGALSAGNGPAMRAPIIGLLASSPEEAIEKAAVSARITHTHPWAVEGTQLVALAAHLSSPDEFFARAQGVAHDPKWIEMLAAMRKSQAEDVDLESFAGSIGCEKGVSGFILQTVPVVLYAWFQDRSFEETVTDVIRLGGDADTTGAIVGGLMGARLGLAAVPNHWKAGVKDWPRSIDYLETLAHDIAEGRPAKDVNGIWCVLRNVFFAAVVITHGFRRLLPPY